MNRRVQIEQAALYQDHDSRRRADYLRQRRNIVERRIRYRLIESRPAQTAVAAQTYDLAMPPDGQRSARRSLVANRGIDGRVDAGQANGVEAARLLLCFTEAQASG